jgi:PAS domain S-box-containing protein
LLTLVLLVAIAVGVTAAFLAWRERPEPGATPLTAILVGQCWWSAFLIFQLQAETLEAKVLWVNVSWIGVVVIPVAWFLFSMDYTGKDHYVRPRYVALLSVIPVVTIALALTDGYHDLLYTQSTLIESGGTMMISRTGGPWYWVIAGYTYLLGVLGMIPLLGLIRSDALPFRGQSVAILVGATVPWMTNLLHLAGATPIPAVDPTPVGFAISGVALLAAIKRFRLLEISPAPNWSAPQLVFERMEEGAIVIDSHDYVVDMNRRMADLLGVTPSEALGRPAAEIVPQYERLPEEGTPTGHLTIPGEKAGRAYDVTVTRIEDFHDRTIGRVVTFHDVQTLLRQQQRLEVLNRVLRHNIRNEITIVSGYADLLSDDDEELGRMIKEHAMDIEEMGEKARTISNIFEREDEPPAPVLLDDLLGRIVENVAEEYPSVDFEVAEPLPSLYVPYLLDPVLRNVVENAAEHNEGDDPFVRVSVEDDDETVGVSIADNGPGIDEFELSVIESGSESALEHASGLGLWLIQWGTTIAGGEVTFEENHPTGSIITVEVPVLSRTEAPRGEPDKVALDGGQDGD